MHSQHQDRLARDAHDLRQQDEHEVHLATKASRNGNRWQLARIIEALEAAVDVAVLALDAGAVLRRWTGVGAAGITITRHLMLPFVFSSEEDHKPNADTDKNKHLRLPWRYDARAVLPCHRRRLGSGHRSFLFGRWRPRCQGSGTIGQDNGQRANV